MTKITGCHFRQKNEPYQSSTTHRQDNDIKSDIKSAQVSKKIFPLGIRAAVNAATPPNCPQNRGLTRRNRSSSAAIHHNANK
jgi:hypothetical protein